MGIGFLLLSYLSAATGRRYAARSIAPVGGSDPTVTFQTEGLKSGVAPAQVRVFALSHFLLSPPLSRCPSSTSPPSNMSLEQNAPPNTTFRDRSGSFIVFRSKIGLL